MQTTPQIASPKLKDLPKEELPRERLLGSGAEELGLRELLSILLGTGSRGETALALADRILARYRGLEDLAQATPAELMKLPGVGEAKATQVLAAVELARRMRGRTLAPGTAIRSSDDVFVHFEPRLRDLRQESFFVLTLDAKNRLIREHRISLGDLTGSSAQHREVFRAAIRDAARSIILLHNHPSGDPTPSPEDVKVTQRLARAGELIGIPVLDHVIIGNGVFRSLADEGEIEPA